MSINYHIIYRTNYHRLLEVCFDPSINIVLVIDHVVYVIAYLDLKLLGGANKKLSLSYLKTVSETQIKHIKTTSE